MVYIGCKSGAAPTHSTYRALISADRRRIISRSTSSVTRLCTSRSLLLRNASCCGTYRRPAGVCCTATRNALRNESVAPSISAFGAPSTETRTSNRRCATFRTPEKKPLRTGTTLSSGRPYLPWCFRQSLAKAAGVSRQAKTTVSRQPYFAKLAPSNNPLLQFDLIKFILFAVTTY